MSKKSLTFKEWKALGFFVIKGEKARGKNIKGVSVFEEDQVVFSEKEIIRNDYDNIDHDDNSC